MERVPNYVRNHFKAVIQLVRIPTESKLIRIAVKMPFAALFGQPSQFGALQVYKARLCFSIGWFVEFGICEQRVHQDRRGSRA
jgi:hypothetical protein